MTGKPKHHVVSYLGFAAWVAYGVLGAAEIGERQPAQGW